MSYIFINIFYVVLIAPLCHPLVWALFLEYLVIFVAILACAAVGLALYVIVIGFIYSEKITPPRRATSAVFEILIFMSTIIGGVAMSVGRIAVGALVLLPSFLRIDKPAITNWVLSWMYLDFPNKSYLSLVKLYSKYNNPIAVTFSENFLLSGEKVSVPTKKMRILWMHKNKNLLKKYRRRYEI